MERRDLSLHNRPEAIRNPQPLPQSVQFDLDKIKEHFDENLDSIKCLSNIADALIQANQIEEGKTIWRSQIVFFEGILDFYLHEVCKYGAYKIFLNDWELTGPFKNIKIPISLVQDVLNSSLSSDWFYDFLNQKYSHEVFMSPESIKYVLNLIGIEYKEVMYKAFPCDKIEESKQIGDKILNKQYIRRNQIAHQMDRSHESAEQSNITKDEVEECLKNITRIVEAIHALAIEKNSCSQNVNENRVD